MNYDVYGTQKACADDIADEWSVILAERAKKGAAISGSALLGRNALTGEVEPTRGRTTAHVMPQQRLDGKWVKLALSEVDSIDTATKTEVAKQTTRKTATEAEQPGWWPAEP